MTKSEQQRLVNVRSWYVLFFVFVVIGLFSFKLTSIAATPPAIFTYQGKLLVGGQPATSTQSISLMLYDAPVGGNVLYTASGTVLTPTAIPVTPSNGLFTVNLGAVGTNQLDPSIFKTTTTLYLQINVGIEALSPRKQITSVPFAINSEFLNGIAATSTPTSSAYIPVADSNGNFGFNGVSTTQLSTTGDLLATGSSTAVFLGGSGVPTVNPVGDVLQTSGAGDKMIWYARQAAFRAGVISTSSPTAWDAANIGFASVAFGVDVTASGIGSFAAGAQNNASGVGSFVAGGSQNTASGLGSFVTGFENVASGTVAFAAGHQSIASGNDSFALGDNMTVNGHDSFGIGLSGSNSINNNNTMAIMGGNVGIGTTTPDTALTVGGDGSIVATGLTTLDDSFNTSTAGTDLPDLGPGTRMVWDAKNAAFRAGSLTPSAAHDWDSSNNGFASAAFGVNNLVSQTAAFAAGYENTVSGSDGGGGIALGGQNSVTKGVAIGINNQTSADGAIAIGGDNVSSGTGSETFGFENTSTNFISIAEGSQMTVAGQDSIGIGLYNYDGTSGSATLSQNNTLAIMGGNVGIGTTTPGTALSVVGTSTFGDIIINGTCTGSGCGGGSSQWVNGSSNSISYSLGNVGIGTALPNAALDVVGNVSFGGTNTIANTSTAFGDQNSATGLLSFTAGSNNATTGTASFAAGIQNNASGTAAVALGYDNIIASNYSVAFGNANKVFQDDTFAIGAGNTIGGSGGNGSGALGWGNFDGGNFGSLAMGYDNTSTGFASLALGAQMTVRGDDSFGIGLSSTQAYELDQPNTFAVMGGNVGIGTTTPGSSLSVVGNIDATSYTCNGGACPGGGDVLAAGNNNFTGLNTFNSTTIFNSNVGIGTTTPANNLTVSGTASIGGVNSVSGLYAFSAGDQNSVAGNYSAAFGSGNTASNMGSFAVGIGTTASGQYSFAGGNSSIASDYFALAYGDNAQATGIASVALGNGVQASGHGAMVIGDVSGASGADAVAIGLFNDANADRSFALGQHASVNGVGSFGIGLSSTPFTVNNSNVMAIMGGNVGIGTTTPSSTLTVIGTVAAGGTNSIVSTAQGTGSVALAGGNAQGIFSFAAGYNTYDGIHSIASGSSSVAFAGGTASGQAAIAFGHNTVASGDASFAANQNTTASGVGSAAFAGGNAGGDSSFSVGYFNNYHVTSGFGSVSLGNYNNAIGYGSTALGTYNTANATNSIAFGTQMTVNGIDSVGINVSDTPAVLNQNNTIALMGGNVGIGTTTPEFMLSIDGDGSIISMGSSTIVEGTHGPAYSPKGAALTTAGAGDKMFWYAKKAAFRAGIISTSSPTAWDDANIGFGSAAFGTDNKTSGIGGFSVGAGNDNEAEVGVALGAFNVVSSSAQLGIAIGSNNIVKGNAAIALGQNVQVDGDNSIGLGLDADRNSNLPAGYDGDLSASNTLGILGGTVEIGTTTAPTAALTVDAGGALLPGGNSGSATYSALFENGNVGIGTKSPGAALEVVGDVISKGTAWTAHATPDNNVWSSVTYGNGRFVAVSAVEVISSPDGTNWTSEGDYFGTGWTSITYGNGIFVAVGGSGNNVLTSPDGIHWTNSPGLIGAGYQWTSVTYGNGRFVATASGGQVRTSADGINWTLVPSNPNNFWQSVTYGNGLFVAVANNIATTTNAMTSPDGITWTSRTTTADFWQSVTYGNGLFVAVGGSGSGNNILTSPDGITWTARTSPANNSWQSVTYGNGLFVAVASTGGITNEVMTSPDGITWTARTSPAVKSWNSVTYGNGLFVAISSGIPTSNQVMTSGHPEYIPFSADNTYQGGMNIFGNVVIGTTTAPGTGYQLFVDSGTSTNPGLGVNGYIKASGFITGPATLDLAEVYPTDPICQASGNCPTAGDAVCLSTTSPGSVSKCTAGAVALGIVSTNPGFTLGDSSQTSSVKVALAGRVPLKVSTANGPINVGDLLTISTTPGIAVKAISPGQTIAMALDNFSSSSSITGTITAFVKLGWSDQISLSPSDVNAPTGFLATIASALQQFGIIIKNGFIQVQQLVVNTLTAKQVNSDNVTTNQVSAQKLCAGSVCVDQDQLMMLLQRNGISGSNPNIPGSSSSTDLGSGGGVTSAPTDTPSSTVSSSTPGLDASSTPDVDATSTSSTTFDSSTSSTPDPISSSSTTDTADDAASAPSSTTSSPTN